MRENEWREKGHTRGESLGFAVRHCSLHHDLLHMAGVLKRIAIENDDIRIFAFAERTHPVVDAQDLRRRNSNRPQRPFHA